MFWELQFANFFVDSLCSLYESDAQKKSRNSRSSRLSWTWQVWGTRQQCCITATELILRTRRNYEHFLKVIVIAWKNIFVISRENIFLFWLFSNLEGHQWTLEKFEMTAKFYEIRMLFEFWEIKTTCNLSVVFGVLKGRDGLWRLKTHSTLLLWYQNQLQWRRGIALILKRTW